MKTPGDEGPADGLMPNVVSMRWPHRHLCPSRSEGKWSVRPSGDQFAQSSVHTSAIVNQALSGIDRGEFAV
jgi:hypothetical protein